jgi:acetyl-CoA acetyltransferase
VSNRVAIAGVGYSDVGRDTGLSYKQLTAQAAKAAMDDAGMTNRDIDGVVVKAFGEPEPWGEPADAAMTDRIAAHMLGISPARYFANPVSNFGDLMQNAIAAVASGASHTCMVLHPCRTMKRKGKPGGGGGGGYGGGGGGFAGIPGDYQFVMPYGAPGPGIVAGLTMQRHMQVYGTTEEQFALQQVAQRYHAGLNERALLRDPLTVDEYLASRFVSRPVRLLDCDYPCDSSTAVILTTEERAATWAKKPVFIESSAAAAIDTTWEYLDDILDTAVQRTAERLWDQTSLTPADVDVAQLYDGFSMINFTWMEGLGFCKPGESGPFVAEGNTRLGGSLPINTDGGVCNIGRHHGGSHCVEAVHQLRGECGPRQVPGAEVSVFTVANGPHCFAALLSVA